MYNIFGDVTSLEANLLNLNNFVMIKYQHQKLRDH